MSPAFVADSFGKAFGERVVLKAATAWATTGRITVLFGRNGSGKSTLLKAATGRVRADWGVVHYAGRAWPRPRLWRLAREGLFFLPDRGLLSRRIPFGEQLGLVRARYGVDPPPGLLESLDVARLRDARAGEMSGGERRRAELALALARRPRCLLADEPLTEVEPKDREVVAELLRARARDGAAVLLTGHEVPDLLDLADEVIWMAGGTTVGLGTPEQACAHHQFSREYLGPRSRWHGGDRP